MSAGWARRAYAGHTAERPKLPPGQKAQLQGRRAAVALGGRLTPQDRHLAGVCLL